VVVLSKVVGAALDATVKVAGRNRVARATRFLNNRARLDVPNAPATNGEHLVIGAIARAATEGSVVIDAGANVGDWTSELLRCAGARPLSVHLFEPSTETHAELRRRLDKPTNSKLTFVQMALSDEAGEAQLSIVHALAGVNSLAARGTAVDTETVQTTTLDSYCSERGLTSIDFVKLDLEGWDCPALRGASGLLGVGAIRAVQFEYNWRWINARSYLRDAFDLLASNEYSIGKVTPRGLERYDAWDADLESFVEANFLALHRSANLDLPVFADWR
jgi:FkbM family methyltransferase